MSKKWKWIIAMVIFLLGIPTVIFLHLLSDPKDYRTCYKNFFTDVYHYYKHEAFGRGPHEPCPARSAPYPAL